MATVFSDIPAWPSENPASNPRAVIGGNLPPPEERIPAEFREALIAERPDFYKKLTELLGTPATETEEAKSGAVDRAKCEDADTLARCGQLVVTLRAAAALVERVRVTAKAPHLEAGRLVDAEGRLLIDQFKDAIARVERLQRDYLDAEDAKAKAAQAEADIKRAELEELAREKGLEEALPPPPPPVSASIPVAGAPLRTDGATISSSKEWKSEVEDYTKAFKHVKDDARVRSAIDAAIQAKVKATKGNAGKPMAGVRMFEATKVNNR